MRVHGHPRHAQEAADLPFVGSDRSDRFLAQLRQHDMPLSEANFSGYSDHTMAYWALVRQGTRAERCRLRGYITYRGSCPADQSASTGIRRPPSSSPCSRRVRTDLMDPRRPPVEVQVFGVPFGQSYCGEHWGGARAPRDGRCGFGVPLLRELDWAAGLDAHRCLVPKQTRALIHGRALQGARGLRGGLPHHTPGALPRRSAACRKSKSTPWSAWVTDWRNSRR